MTSVITQDGTFLVRDAATGITASGRTYAEALSELRRLLAIRPVKALPARAA